MAPRFRTLERIVSLPGTLDDIKRWGGLFAAFSLSAVGWWEKGRVWAAEGIVSRAEWVAAVDMGLRLVGTFATIALVLMLLAMGWTHTGIHWTRRWGDLSAPPSIRDAPAGVYVNVGALGRPANDGRTEVWYAVLQAAGRELSVELVPVTYDHQALAVEMRSEKLPEEFVQTILTGWWTTCLEILPGKERARGRF